MDFVYGAAANLLMHLLFDNPGVLSKNQKEPTIAKPAIEKVAPSPVRFPNWVRQVPKDCFVGISTPEKTISKARAGAFDSALCQVLQAMGAVYALKHDSVVSGDTTKSSYSINERLSYTARWLIQSIQKNIRETEFVRLKGRYVSFLLLYCPEEELQRLRRLTIGPKLSARIDKIMDDRIFLNIAEANGVGATFANFHAYIKTENMNADVITLFFLKVPKSSFRHLSGAITPAVKISDSMKQINISNPIKTASFKDKLLGAKARLSITLFGYDEIGRKVSIPVADI